MRRQGVEDIKGKTPLDAVAAAYSGPINTTGHNAHPFKNAWASGAPTK
jgi:hypothetical protein